MPDISHSVRLDFAIILLATRTLAALANRLGMPRVIGELTAGLLRGPALISMIELNYVVKIRAEIGVSRLGFDVG